MQKIPNEDIRAYLANGHTKIEAAAHFSMSKRNIDRRLRQLEDAEIEAAEQRQIEQQKQAEIDRVESEARAIEQRKRDAQVARIAALPAGVSIPKYAVVSHDGSEDWQPWVAARLRDRATGRSTLDTKE